MVARFEDIDPAYCGREDVADLVALLCQGGDARIALDPQTGLNRYLAAPYPRRTLALASSTANDISRAAFDHLLALMAAGLASHDDHLDALRRRIRMAYGLENDTGVVFTPSGTDCEFVALAAVQGRAKSGVHNILLGADEVGSGCIHSARGCHFAESTALGHATEPGEPVPGMAPVTLCDIPVRCARGEARGSRELAQVIRAEIVHAREQQQHALLHVVHGSKTGLILPRLREIDALRAEFGAQLSLVVDACQARITSGAVRDYLARGAIVLLTGSKFMGGPPFSGFALVPARVIERTAALPPGFARLYRRAEWDARWAGCEMLEQTANPGLALRLEASVFELERFQALGQEAVRRVILAFQRAIRALLLHRNGFGRIEPYRAGNAEDAADHPLEMLTLATLDVSAHPQAGTFDDARVLHRSLDRKGLRLGQPVKCIPREDGSWAGTLRAGLSMPQICALAELSDHDLESAMFERIGRFADALAVPA
ncbi:MAG: hypothetical protein RIC51_10980 [Erythrobacter sp.]|uniref:hypothetical protein n=1 Tax=Erythrobacter sp. TaxID=1042 RepID=UPI0032ED4D52